jgi:hypothetical protein
MKGEHRRQLTAAVAEGSAMAVEEVEKTTVKLGRR